MVAFLAISLTTSWVVAAVALLVLGAGTAFWNVTVATVRQRVTPRHLLGRVGSAFEVLTNGAVTFGAPAGGLLAAAAGLPAALLLPAFVAGGTAVLLFARPPTAHLPKQYTALGKEQDLRCEH
jgi:MFS family permease